MKFKCCTQGNSRLLWDQDALYWMLLTDEMKEEMFYCPYCGTKLPTGDRQTENDKMEACREKVRISVDDVGSIDGIV